VAADAKRSPVVGKPGRLNAIADAMRVRATAKINLFLKVLELRPDGYHDIETVYQSVGLSDRLEFIETRGGRIELECDDPALPVGEENLVVRAAELVRRRFPDRMRGLRVRLEKAIPPESGLGGGSADAAATLRACNEMFGLGLSVPQLRRLGAHLGMDVPFLIEGGCAIGRGRGELIEPLEDVKPVWAVLVVPEARVSTRWAYEQLDRAKPAASVSLESFVAQLMNEPFEVWARSCYNSFESVVFPRYPPVRRVRDRLLKAGCAGAVLAGSGSAVVGLASDEHHARSVADEFRPGNRLAEAVPFVVGSDSNGPGG